MIIILTKIFEINNKLKKSLNSNKTNKNLWNKMENKNLELLYNLHYKLNNQIDIKIYLISSIQID